MPDKVKRFGVSVEADLLKSFDNLIAKRGYANRCEALRDLMRQALVDEAWDRNAEIVGTITLVYDHHDPGLVAELTHLQHHHSANVIATMHAHVNRDDCVEAVLVRGKAKAIKRLADALISTKGVKHGQLAMSAAGKALH